MKTRREFLRDAGIIAASAMVLPTAAVSNPLYSEEKRIRIGIIGAENTHTVGYGKLFNIENKFPGITVDYVWGETDKFAEKAAAKGQIPNIVTDPLEMIGKIDALIVDHRHAKYHLKAALPFVKAKIPTFIDKPFCYRVEEGKKFLEIAREYGTPVSSYSSAAQNNKTFDIRAQVEMMDDIEQVVMIGPADIASKYGGIFFYGVHMVQPMLNIFGEDVESVRVNRDEKKATGSVRFSSGLLATLVFTKARNRATYVVRKEGIVLLKPRVEESDPPKHYREIVEMFRSGKEPKIHESILKSVAVLEALEKSVETGKWEQVMI